MAASAASLESYSPIIFMPSAISVTTEHFWLAVSMTTKYLQPPVSTAKAGMANALIRTAATRYFLILGLLWMNLRNGKPRIKHIRR